MLCQYNMQDKFEWYYVELTHLPFTLYEVIRFHFFK